MSELTTQAERYEQLSRKFTSLYHSKDEGQYLVVSDLEAKIDELAEVLTSEHYLKKMNDIFQKDMTFLLEMVISTVSQDRSLVIKRVNFFGSDEGLYLLKTLPVEKDIQNPQNIIEDFHINYAQRFRAIKNQIIQKYSSNLADSILKLQKTFGLQLTEEIVSGGEGLARSVISLPTEEIERNPDFLYKPISLIRIPIELQEDRIPVEPRLMELIDDVPLSQPGRDLIEINTGVILQEIFTFCSSLLASIHKRYSLNEQQSLLNLYSSYVNGLKDIIGSGSIDWVALLPQMKNLVEKISLEKQDDVSEEKETHEMLEFARRRSTSFLIYKWYEKFVKESIIIIRKKNKQSILDFISQSDDLISLTKDQTHTPEEILDDFLEDFQKFEETQETEDREPAIRKLRSSIQGRIIESRLLEEFTKYCIQTMHVSCNINPMSFEPNRNVSKLLSNLDEFRKSDSWDPREIEKTRQSINLVNEDLNNLKPRRITTEDLDGLFEYLNYWGIDPPGGSLLHSGTIFFSFAETPWLMSFQLDRLKGLIGLVCLQSTSEEKEITEDLHDYRSLQAVISRLKDQFEDCRKIVVPIPEEPLEDVSEEVVEEVPEKEPIIISDEIKPSESPFDDAKLEKPEESKDEIQKEPQLDSNNGSENEILENQNDNSVDKDVT